MGNKPQPELNSQLLDLINDLLARINRSSKRDENTKNLLERIYILRDCALAREQDYEETKRVLDQYEEAYEKLTSPANRLAVFLGLVGEENALIALGDTEYLTTIDPKLDKSLLKIGTRVIINDAYSVINELGFQSGGPIVAVNQILEGGKVRVATDPTGNQSRIVALSDIIESEIKIGDEVRVEPSFHVAVEHFPKKESREYYFEDVPEIPWSKVGGQATAIQLIKDTIELPLLHPELYAKYDKKNIKGILLYGPPGCGKTLIGKATAYNLTKEYSERLGRPVKEYFMVISGPKILNMWLGETERMVREIFAAAREKAKEGNLVFIFIDEAESILRTRSSGRWLNISNTVVPQFAAEMDGLVSMENVVVMLTSNRPDYIDPAILRPERIDRKVKISRPDKNAAREILSIYLHENIPLNSEGINGDDIQQNELRDIMLDKAADLLWNTTAETEFIQVYLRNGGIDTLYWKDLVSGALLKSVIDRAKDFAIKRAIANHGQDNGVTLDDINNAIRLEYKENEIFPKSDTMEDWLKLLDYEPENISNIRPIQAGKRFDISKGII